MGMFLIEDVFLKKIRIRGLSSNLHLPDPLLMVVHKNLQKPSSGMQLLERWEPLV